MSGVPVWIDTDTGVDDAIALMAAIALQRQKKLEIVGISAVCGNAEQARTFENARNVVNLAGRPDIPVYPGASKPIMVELQTAAYVHGEDGLGGAVLPASKAARETEMAWDALYRCAREWKGELELILIGPETNAAIAFQKYPDLKNYLKKILIMGGAAVGGNRTPAAEFNIWVDPHAAQIVFKSQVPIIMCGLDVTMRAELNSAKIGEIENCDSAACRLFRDSTKIARNMYSGGGEEVYYAHDVCPVLYVVYPELFSGVESGVFVETRGTITRGQTVTDYDTDVKFGVKNARVILGADRQRFAEILIDLLKSI